LASAKVSIGNFFAGDQLSADTTGTSIVADYNATTGVLTLTGSDNIPHYNQVLDGITFASSSDNPTNFGTDTSRTISWTVNDGALDSNTGSTTINVTAVNDAPVIAGAGNTTGSTEKAAGVTIDAGLTASDVDNQNLASAKVSIGNFFAGDQLSADTTGTSIVADYNATTGVLTLTGSDTIAHYNQVLDGITFASSSDNPTNFGTDTSRTFSWTGNDGALDSHTGSTTINVTAVNDAPVIAGAGNTTGYPEAE